MEGLISFILIILLVFLAGLAYKNRHTIARWLNDTNLTVTDKKRKKYLTRSIEDAEEEIDEINEREKKGGD